MYKIKNIQVVYFLLKKTLILTFLFVRNGWFACLYDLQEKLLDKML